MSIPKKAPVRTWAAVVKSLAGTPDVLSRSSRQGVSPSQESLCTEPSPPASIQSPITSSSPDVESPVSAGDWAFDIDDAVLICIDIKCHCRNQTFAEFSKGIKRSERRVCEIGMASFDSREITMEEAGDRAHKAWPRIKSENLAIIENKHVFCKKHPYWCKVRDANNFQFGKTRWVRKAIVKDQFIKQVKTWIGESTELRSAPKSKPHVNSRPIVWVFFADANDRTWLEELGISLEDEFPNSRRQDIQNNGPNNLARRIAHRTGKPQIGAPVLFRFLGLDCDIEGLHNGGNDATWELRAYLAECALTGVQFQNALSRRLPGLK
ncbi:hypothetical protein LTR84_007542 [Exophiala bonariae]|uniref:Gfd2/YDR514C-like C-terminal domain-containing protein n=1 Tax=Exophiala bonariae TaxID=1690606 RepID=A0AAV9NKC6_9EURO|nr:hypothetical protein LTR84_007542 [Exophiala bonariae]